MFGSTLGIWALQSQASAHVGSGKTWASSYDMDFKLSQNLLATPTSSVPSLPSSSCSRAVYGLGCLQLGWCPDIFSCDLQRTFLKQRDQNARVKTLFRQRFSLSISNELCSYWCWKCNYDVSFQIVTFCHVCAFNTLVFKSNFIKELYSKTL